MHAPKHSFTEGLRDGLPIFLGYVSVAFAFGIYPLHAPVSVFYSTSSTLIDRAYSDNVISVLFLNCREK